MDSSTAVIRISTSSPAFVSVDPFNFFGGTLSSGKQPTASAIVSIQQNIIVFFMRFIFPVRF